MLFSAMAALAAPSPCSRSYRYAALPQLHPPCPDGKSLRRRGNNKSASGRREREEEVNALILFSSLALTRSLANPPALQAGCAGFLRSNPKHKILCLPQRINSSFPFFRLTAWILPLIIQMMSELTGFYGAQRSKNPVQRFVMPFCAPPVILKIRHPTHRDQFS